MSKILACDCMHEGPYAELITDDFVDSLVQATHARHRKGRIPDEILTKPGKLTDEEFQIMKTHTDIGRRVLSQALDPTPTPFLCCGCVLILPTAIMSDTTGVDSSKNRRRQDSTFGANHHVSGRVRRDHQPETLQVRQVPRTGR